MSAPPVPREMEGGMLPALEAWRRGAPLRLPPMELVHASIDGQPVTFCLNIARDPIQNAHRAGQFYEAEELAAIGTLVPRGGVFLDIGANVGNHALYFALMLGARRVMVIEPNPLALPALVGNVLANGLDGRVDLSRLGFGLSDHNAGGYAMKRHDVNLGATRLRVAPEGDLTVRIGDEVFPRARPDLVKIDVEGMEMGVLRGLEALIARARPVLLVEVDEENAGEFAGWAERHRYRIHLSRRHGARNINHILVADAA
mgnify:FL=1